MNDKVSDSESNQGFFANLGRTKELQVLAWTTAIAVFAGFVHFLGYLSQHGADSALAVHGFATAGDSEHRLYLGSVALVVLASIFVSVVICGLITFKLTHIIVTRLFPTAFKRLSEQLQHPSVWWISFVALVVFTIVLNVISTDLIKNATDMVLKTTSEIGDTWSDAVFDTDSSGIVYLFALCLAQTVVCLLAWRVRAGFRNPLYRNVFVAWVVIQLLSFLVMDGFIYGVTTSIDEFPSVTFSGQEQLLGKNAVPLLVGSDDKQVALLVLYPCAPDSGLRKTVLYLPRSEIKWMTSGKALPIHLAAHLGELNHGSDVCNGQSSH
jgi:hypothetical protein